MNSISNYTVTAQDGGLVCSATWRTIFDVYLLTDSTVVGSATAAMQGPPLCTHPEYLPNPTTSMVSDVSGNATATQIELRLSPVSNQPAGSIDATGLSPSIYGIDGKTPATITIPVTSAGHAAGSQVLQTISGTNSYTSENSITLDCDSC